MKLVNFNELLRIKNINALIIIKPMPVKPIIGIHETNVFLAEFNLSGIERLFAKNCIENSRKYKVINVFINKKKEKS